jgi:acetyl esterase/lipase
MGDSAGGGMAAALTILTRERGGPKIARQILLMPMLDDRTRTSDPD